MARHLHHLPGILGITLATVISSAAIDFDFKDPKGVNSVSFHLDSPLEPFSGMASAVSGLISFDPEAPDLTSGRIQIAASSLWLANERMAAVLQSEEWLDVTTYPVISFTFDEVLTSEPGPEEGSHIMTVTGDFECRGVIREMTNVVTVTHLPGMLGDRMGGEMTGDILTLRSELSIQRVDFNIKPDLGFGKVANTIHIHVAIVGSAEVAVAEDVDSDADSDADSDTDPDVTIDTEAD